ncbi:DegT/DnrJ/EryC1/StrS family aminotransferase [Acidobacteria bacterium AH-259-D05]|nr:DegT/DnrJ/EryC1/StrS family aminotransferase [Acidobacteria bacterium AH-259-D05]
MRNSSRGHEIDRSQSHVISVGTLSVSSRAKELVLETLNNNRLSYGPMTQRFEAEFARRHGCRFGIMSNSGTSALQIALQSMKELHGWEDGDEVIVPAVTFVATVNIVIHNRMHPVLVDVDPRYYELDPELLEARISSRTRAVIPVHLFGHPAEMDPIREIAARYGLKIIEDSCQTMFATYNGQPVGGLGDIGCFSTYAAHLLVTGVGGISTTNDPEYAIRLRSLMNHGRDSIYISIDDDKNKSTEELRMVVARRFKFVNLGHSFRITEMEAALGLAQLEECESIVAARRANARSLLRKLAHLESYLQLPSTRPNSEHSFMMFPIVVREEPKVELVDFLEQNGIETRDMLPLTNQPVYHQLLAWREEDHPVAKRLNKNGFYVGCHQNLTEADLDYMAESFERFVRLRPSQAREGACLIITACNDKVAVERTLEEIPKNFFQRIVAIENRSRDGSLELLESQGIEVVRLEGQDVVHTIVNHRVAVDHDCLVFFAADGRHNPRDVGRLLLALERGNDMVIASRFLHGGARRDRYPRIRYRSIGNRVFTLLANLLFYGNFSDTLSTFLAVRRQRLVEVHLDEAGLAGFYQLSIRAMQRRWKVAEVPSIELVNPEREQDARKQILLSLWPLTRVLLKEWWRSKSNA